MNGHSIRHVIVRGRVQGVGYRLWMQDLALEHGVEGWVRNRRDGAVEAVFAGPAEAIEQIVAACRRGPPAAGSAAWSSAKDRRQSLPCAVPASAFRCCPQRDQNPALPVRAASALPNNTWNWLCSTASTSAIVAGTPRSARLVTP